MRRPNTLSRTARACSCKPGLARSEVAACIGEQPGLLDPRAVASRWPEVCAGVESAKFEGAPAGSPLGWLGSCVIAQKPKPGNMVGAIGDLPHVRSAAQLPAGHRVDSTRNPKS